MQHDALSLNSSLRWRKSRPSNLRSRSIATLGPPGTSSERAARELLYRQEVEDLTLFSSYENAAIHTLAHRGQSALLVANAYHAINRFYISSEFAPVAAFFCDTPSYVLATKQIKTFRSILYPRIATHPAPAHRIDSLLGHSDYQRLDMSSTSAAAQAVIRDEADGCLTTAIAQKDAALIALSPPFTIPMLWTIFFAKEETA